MNERLEAEVARYSPQRGRERCPDVHVLSVLLLWFAQHAHSHEANDAEHRDKSCPDPPARWRNGWACFRGCRQRDERAVRDGGDRFRQLVLEVDEVVCGADLFGSPVVRA
ncbi:MAG: hypothetical protein IPG74_14530 [Flavobacteriales bacterium]|nr:hypothetical protein [Flavobacteriales bacterium]